MTSSPVNTLGGASPPAVYSGRALSVESLVSFPDLGLNARRPRPQLPPLATTSETLSPRHHPIAHELTC